MRSRKNLSQALTGIMGLRVNVQCNDIFQAEDLNSSPFSANLLFCLQMAIASISLNDKDAKSCVGTCISRAYYRCLLHILPIVYCIMLVANISLISLPIVYYAYCLYLFELQRCKLFGLALELVASLAQNSPPCLHLFCLASTKKINYYKDED